MRPTRCIFDRHGARIEACMRNSAHVEQYLAIIACHYYKFPGSLISGDLSPMVFALVNVGGE